MQVLLVLFEWIEGGLFAKWHAELQEPELGATDLRNQEAEDEELEEEVAGDGE